MLAYPSDLSPEDLAIVTSLFQGHIYCDQPTARHALWQFAGVCESHVLPNAPAGTATPLAHPQVVTHLTLMQRGILSGIPWAQLLATALALLQQLLGGMQLTPIQPPESAPPKPAEKEPEKMEPEKAPESTPKP